MSLRVGIGSDTHKLSKGKKLWIGGVDIPSEMGCIAHSDGDALIHAICDALLGALSLRDIGYHFPDSKEENTNRDSSFFLIKVKEMMDERKYEILNIDSIVHLESPKLYKYIDRIKNNISKILNLELSGISVKAKTGEGIGIVGQGEAIKTQAVVLLKKKN